MGELAPTLHLTIAMAFARCTEPVIFGTKPALCMIEEFMKATLDPEYGRYKAIFNIFEMNYGAASDMRSTLMVYLPTPAG